MPCFYPCGKGPSFILSTIQYPMKEQADDGATMIDGIRTDRKLCGTGKPFVKAERQGRQLVVRDREAICQGRETGPSVR
jgi:hypothetical protein